MSCKISTLDKKSIVVTEYYTKRVGDEVYRFDVETVWRWGYAIVEEDADDIEIHDNELVVTDYSIVDQDYQDGTSLFWKFSDNVPDEVREDIEFFLEENDYSQVEELGWWLDDVVTVFIGDLEIEQLDDDEEEEEEPVVDPNKPTWPFS